MAFDQIMQMLGQVAFPAVICVALLWERSKNNELTAKAITAMTSAVAELKNAVTELTAYIKGGSHGD